MRMFLLELLILCFTISIQVRTNSGEVYSFGSSFTGQEPEDPDGQKNIYLLPNFATSDGFVFAFSAVVMTQEPAVIIIYRPSSNCSMANLQAVGHIWYYPSVAPGWRENVYMESYYNKGCIPVKKYDMVGLYFPNGASISAIFGKPKGTFLEGKQCFDSGRIRHSLDDVKGSFASASFDPVDHPYQLEIEVFYYTNAQGTSPTTTCEKGHLIPLNKTVSIRPPTTTPPIKGAPGLKGVVGQTGLTGDRGDIGSIGKPGYQGQLGDLGLPGLQGSTGERGPIGVQGDVGPTGLQGPNGSKGLTGVNGAKGDTGLQGAPGYPGRNVTVLQPKRIEVSQGDNLDPLRDDPYFGEDKAIWALFIWMAILTFVALLTLIFLATSGTWLNKM